MPLCMGTIYLKAERLHVPCGTCGNCLQARRLDWSFRLEEEKKNSSSSDFLTLTYADQSLPDMLASNTSELIATHYGSIPTLHKPDLQLFTKRLRKAQSEITSATIRYYSVGEYGTKTQRPHYHSIMFNLHDEVRKNIRDIWGLGNVKVGQVTPASIRYVTKYLINKTQYNGIQEKPFTAISNRSGGLGKSYLSQQAETYHRTQLQPYITTPTNTIRLPRYYKDRIFSDSEKERISQRTQLDARNQEIERYHYLKSKGHENPFAYIEEQKIYHEQNIKNKANEKDTF